MITIVTGASQNHSKSMINLIHSIYKNSNVDFQLYVYDLGLTDEYKNNLLKLFPNIILKIFDYTKYPDYFNININAGEYAWKPAIINEVLSEINDDNEILLWLDAGNYINGPIEHVLNVIRNNKIFSPSTEADIKRWCHKKVIQYFGIENNQNALNFRMKNGAIIGLHIKTPEIKELINNFYKYALVKDAICPDGSSRQNHRQDQALFTILSYFYQLKNKNNFDDNYYMIRTHCDCD
jgi:hypothetical protein